jgi:outer membrane biosynthesis protein TonB
MAAPADGEGGGDGTQGSSAERQEAPPSEKARETQDQPTTGKEPESTATQPSGIQPPADSGVQVPSPSVTLPTPPLPPPLQEATPEPQNRETPQPTPEPKPEFNPPTAQELNAPGSQPPGNPLNAPASAGMPSVTLNDSNPGEGGDAKPPGLLGSMFDWARKLRFTASVRGGYDSNVNSSRYSPQASSFGNINGAINYRFGAPRLNFEVTLTGGLTAYPQADVVSNRQGIAGLALAAEYRYSPRLIFNFVSSTSLQQQPNMSLAGTPNQIPDSTYYYTANSFSGSYQWSDLFTTITRLSLIGTRYQNASLNSQLGAFSQPDFNQSFRWLLKPNTTAVVDFDSNLYLYTQGGNSTWGNTLSGGFDHIFNPKMFWNHRLGAEFRTYQNSNASGSYIGPYMDNNINWKFGQRSNLAWLIRIATQPSGQQNISFTPSLNSGLNYTQTLTSKINANLGLFYLMQYFSNSGYGYNGTGTSYWQNNLQGNLAFNYAINRILQLTLGYQYITTMNQAVPSAEYNRGISYLQLGGNF